MPRLSGWAPVRLFRLQTPPRDHWLPGRRSRRDPADRAYYVAFAPMDVSLAEPAAIAGLRWIIETCFDTAKGELGPDHCEARSWAGWRRHMMLHLAALAFLARLRTELLRAAGSNSNERSPWAAAAA